MDEVVVADCPFCGLGSGDDRRHWVNCSVLKHIFNELYEGSTALVMDQESFHLQVPLDGRELQQFFAFMHAIWRCRCVILRGYEFNYLQDLVDHFRSIVEDPWLHGNPVVLSRVERRTLRSIAPSLPSDTYIYFFDGASRNQEGTRSASFGALLRYNNIVIARVAVFLNDATNNEAEYQGALAVLQHAVSMQYNRILVYGDSKLIVSQLNGVWRCKANNLTVFYEQGLALVRRLHETCADNAFGLAHVYREFNADADSLANVGIDRRTRATAVVVNDGWYGRLNPQTFR
jgi:ribonuclease HI